ncbi:MAG: UDP-N-acetylglucosamine 2-epimerase, partial [Propioniciclava sp.]
MHSPKRTLAVVGTRPEGIKMLPVVQSLLASPHLDVVGVDTGQHQEILTDIFQLFDYEPSIRLDVMRPGQALSPLFARVLNALDPILAAEQPDALLIQGDTTTAMAAGLAAFHRRIPVVHVEAGLRTDTVHNPFPEEANRRLTARIASLHLAPTATSRDN